MGEQFDHVGRQIAGERADAADQSVAPARKTIEAWRDEKRTRDWLFRAAFLFARWALRQEVTEAEYDATIKATREQRLR